MYWRQKRKHSDKPSAGLPGWRRTPRLRHQLLLKGQMARLRDKKKSGLEFAGGNRHRRKWHGPIEKQIVLCGRLRLLMPKAQLQTLLLLEGAREIRPE
jgi:hypothetical protein